MARDTKKITKNTLILYVRLLLSMCIGLYTSRVVLQVLGVDDFGIYNVVGGVVAMFGVFNAAMASSSSRFITFELGRGEGDNVRNVFGTSLLIHIGLALLVGIGVLILGSFFMQQYMNIPVHRLESAKWAFYCAVFSSCIYIATVPYNAMVVAHEKMNVVASLSILEMVLKLIAVYFLQFIGEDKLESYALLLVLSQLVVQVLYVVYCWVRFKEARSGISLDRNFLKLMTSFAGWSIFGEAAAILFTQGLNILLNIFFGTAVNAARGIAVQVQSLVSRFVGGFQTAVNPQITKSFANHDLTYMHRLIIISSKYSFFMLLLLCLPIMLETERLLTWWLTVVPPHTVNFIRIILMTSMIECLANPLIFAVKATGRIKMYQFIMGSLMLLVVPISYVALKMGLPAESVFAVHLIITLVGHTVRVVLISPMIKLPVQEYLNKVLLKCVIILVTGCFLPILIYFVVPDSVTRLFTVSCFGFLSIASTTYLFGMDKIERYGLKQLVISKISLPNGSIKNS